MNGIDNACHYLSKIFFQKTLDFFRKIAYNNNSKYRLVFLWNVNLIQSICFVGGQFLTVQNWEL